MTVAWQQAELVVDGEQSTMGEKVGTDTEYVEGETRCKAIDERTDALVLVLRSKVCNARGSSEGCKAERMKHSLVN